jgi:EAL domain-containing protein (putative c-di-GMP-specific phosphodiesterase class I)
MLQPYRWAENKINNTIKKNRLMVSNPLNKGKMNTCPYIQPIICSSTRRLMGAEVLLRLKDERGNYFSANADFADEMLDKFTLKLIDDIQTSFLPLRNRLPTGFFFTFNICASQIANPVLKTSAYRFADDFNMMLEVNERSINDIEDPMLESIQEMMDAGIQFAIDDFGAGCSSLKYLENMGFCMLKLNRDLTLIHRGELVYKKTVAALAGLAIMLNIRLGAEGIQSEDQARCLAERGVNLLQGRHYSHPLPVNEFISNYIA